MMQVQASWARFEAPELQPMDRGCPPGSIWFTFPAAPPIGAPVHCAVCSNKVLEAGKPGPLTPRQYRLRSGQCRPFNDLYTPPGTNPVYGNAVLSQVNNMLNRWRQEVQPPVPGALG